jgi:hypothetical protein
VDTPPRRTEVRHRILHAASIGKVRLAPKGSAREWDFKVYFTTYPQMARAANTLWEAGLLQFSDDFEVLPTTAGDNELYRWNNRYGRTTF